MIKTLEVELTTVGGMGEVFYPQAPKKHIDLGKLLNFISEIKKSEPELKQVLLRGVGEPILYPQFSKAVEKFLDLGLSVGIFTFPYLFPRYLELLGNDPRLSYTIYLYPNKKDASCLEGIKDTNQFKKEEKINLNYFLILDSQSYPYLRAFAEQVKKEKFCFSIINHQNGKEKITQEIFNQARKTFEDAGCGKNIQWENGWNPLNRCTYLRFERAFVNAENKLAFCHFLAHLRDANFGSADKFKDPAMIKNQYSRINTKKIFLVKKSTPKEGLYSPCDFCKLVFG
jgi:hypothetical protein